MGGKMTWVKAMSVADPFAIQQACLQWAHSVTYRQAIAVSLHFPCNTQATTTPEQPPPSTEPSHCSQSHAQQGSSAQPYMASSLPSTNCNTRQQSAEWSQRLPILHPCQHHLFFVVV
ncbi:hypothetical protein ABBQ32_011478 [Trebouxia sp. C0010 RCD-2024]